MKKNFRCAISEHNANNHVDICLDHAKTASIDDSVVVKQRQNYQGTNSVKNCWLRSLGHISPQCPKPKKESQSGGKVFALSGSETSADDRLIRGTLW
ncbi:hypothetical protein KIW84_050333 [Lathyrus oleraceus]|uniref:Uncharacterized protein n=1 Tax=Pisum sativum TaxID=3888 RepID=A0A9D4WJJ8_PEA|nr:hypothetical protein KIW84_050333 [Pisum sativum]